ncbi:UDP-Glycosyltransferase/glycogen phosphorylase [Dacryopinax primogenitus]|uniref:Alpha-1,3/1,6-mannosyltransferase ALG2 n=1 Tax=Dacryopinax primogenitus (strain DJM 731) TaxID=1858805 RepID=M5GAK6_DACPD|nr:UDP-Glycosyltransferase/glycogen phosphorylase [Dacryopinax primogenitus]EJU05889.1 UDP-Glycosyltransferase/glycogen phosphorylase [Dacryopinax primogenitus]
MAKKAKSQRLSSLRIAIIHPDLGIGGAERLIVDSALGLQRKGHEVEIFTSHHDPKHCFEETANGSLKVTVVNPGIPASLLGHFRIIFAILRQLYIYFYLYLLITLPHSVLRIFGLQQIPSPDVFLIDQLSTVTPLVRWFLLRRVVFYCHFPDKLLSGGKAANADGEILKEGIVKRIYRMPINVLEEITTGNADLVIANSLFTARVFKKAFPMLSKTPRVIYPGINLAAYQQDALEDTDDARSIRKITADVPFILSTNRFEEKKNIALAVEAFAQYRATHRPTRNTPLLRLVLAGGYDPRLEDNVRTLAHLRTLCDESKLSYAIVSPQTFDLPTPAPSVDPSGTDVIFLLNFTTAQRTTLLLSPQNLLQLYTPTNEHFGIGPVEAMACGVPVLATNTGGPIESIVDEPEAERTGWLCPADPEKWAEAIDQVVRLSAPDKAALAERAKERVRINFTQEIMCEQLDLALWSIWEQGSMDHRMRDALCTMPIAAAAGMVSLRFGLAEDVSWIVTLATFVAVAVYLSNSY